MKDALIKQILDLKPQATKYGFDWPTEDPQNATFEDLEWFLDEVEQFLAEVTWNGE